MKKIKEIKELNTEKILELSRKYDFDICTNVDFKGKTLIQDEESLAMMLIELKAMFLVNDDKNMYYSIKDEYVAVPFVTDVYSEEECIIDVYLNFNELKEVNGATVVNYIDLVSIKNDRILRSIYKVLNRFFYNNDIELSTIGKETIKDSIKTYINTIFNAKEEHTSVRTTKESIVSDILDIVDNVLKNEDILADSNEIENEEDETFIYGILNYELKYELDDYLSLYIF